MMRSFINVKKEHNVGDQLMEPYKPEKLPPKSIDWEMHISLIGKANYALAQYNGILQGIINPQVLLSPLTVREAVISSRIEGTQASLEDVLQYEADMDDLNGKDGSEDKYNKDIHEIRNYRKAMSAAVEKLAERPLGINLIRDLHRILLSDVRGKIRNRVRLGVVKIGLVLQAHPSRKHHLYHPILLLCGMHYPIGRHTFTKMKKTPSFS
jgi:Fic family protein